MFSAYKGETSIAESSKTERERITMTNRGIAVLLSSAAIFGFVCGLYAPVSGIALFGLFILCLVVLDIASDFQRNSIKEK